jgi:hypothetical protein
VACAVACLLLAGSAVAAPKHTRDTPHFHFIYDADKVIDVETMQQSAEAAYGHISGLLSYSPSERIPVILYADRREFLKEAHQDRRELVVGTATNEDTIRLDASRIFDAPDRVIGHEIVHVFLFRMLGPRVEAMPLWMNEGLAQEAGGADPAIAHARVVGALLENRLLPLSDLRSSFPTGDNAGLAYDQGQDAVDALLDRGGWPAMRDLVGRLARGASYDAAMRTVYGYGADDWAAKWRRDLQLGSRSRVFIEWAEWIVPGMFFIALIWGFFTVRNRRRRQVQAEEPVSDLAPPSWWREDEFRR